MADRFWNSCVNIVDCETIATPPQKRATTRDRLRLRRRDHGHLHSPKPDDLGMLMIAKDYDVVTLLSMKLDFARDNPHVGTSAVPERKAQLLEILPALRRNAMGPHDHDRILFLFLRKRQILLALIVAYLSDVFVTQGLHHLLVVNQRAIRVDPALSRMPLPGLPESLAPPPSRSPRFWL